MANSLNEQFYKCFNKQGKDIHTMNLDTSVTDVKGLYAVNFEYQTVRDIIRTLPNKRSHDYDGFSYAILKGGGDILASQLARLFSLSFKYEMIPNDWRKSVIILLTLE